MLTGINFHLNKIQYNDLLFAGVDDEQEDDKYDNQQEYKNTNNDTNEYYMLPEKL